MKKLTVLIHRRLARFAVRYCGGSLARQLYLGVFGRDASRKELSRAKGAIQRSGSIAPAVKKILNSKKFRAISFDASVPKIVVEAYRGILGRDPDKKHLKAHVIDIRTNKNAANFFSTLIDSSEFSSSLASKKPTRLAAVPVRGAGRLIIVSSDCQAAGMTSALQAFFPHDSLFPLPIPDVCNPQSVERFIQDISDADAWVSHLDLAWAENHGFQPKAGFQFVKIPRLRFSAFHPDLCYARNLNTGNYTRSNYESAIGIWAYTRQLTVADAAKLFSRENYAKLGYFDHWNPSVSLLRSSFESCNLDFTKFMLPVKRTGLFMYSFNHPKVAAVIELAKQVAVKFGASASVVDGDIHIQDSLLSGAIWPFYPEIADELSLPDGSYNWRLKGMWIKGVNQYLEYAFSDYKSQGLMHDGIRMEYRDEALYDLVLGNQVAAMK